MSAHSTSEPIIEVTGLGKSFRRRFGARYDTLRERITSFSRRTVGRAPEPSKTVLGSDTGLFWALRDVNFSVQKGEVLGIIGRNGAGKSTLLKVLARITTPTEGQVTLRGRTGSLLEVGTGFHPELSGRENIFLNGAILGMTKREVESKLDDIVSFSGVQEFLDMPVKRYSSGMTMRLAFSVAAQLDPEILVVDEVLAVGDADFQNKCLQRMSDIAKEKRTVLFVSHNMNAVKDLCTRVIWVDKGQIIEDTTDVEAITNRYLFGDSDDGLSSDWVSPRDGDMDNDSFALRRFAITDRNGETLAGTIRNDVPFSVRIEFDLKYDHPSMSYGFAVISEDGHTVFWSTSADGAEHMWPVRQIGRNVLICNLPSRLLNEGLYRFDLFAGQYEQQHYSHPGITPVSAHLRIKGGLSDSPQWRVKRAGIIAPALDWAHGSDGAKQLADTDGPDVKA